MPVASAALLASALLHASWNALLKRERAPQVAVAGVLSSAVLFAVAAALASGRSWFATGTALGWALAAGVFEGLYFVTLAAALARADYGVVYTVARGGAMVVVWPAGALVLREGASVAGVLGAALVAVGLGLVAGVAGRRAQRAGLAFAAACAASIAGYHLCYDRALAAGARPAPLFAVALATALPCVFATVRRSPGTVIDAAGGSRLATAARWGLAGALCTGSFLLFLVGLAASGAAVALTLRNSSVCFAQALAFAIGERPARRQVAGAVLVALGAALVA